MLRAYTAYRSQAADPWRLVLLGDGPERGTLEHLIAAESIEGVTLAGFRQIDELPAYYGLASAFVHPALTDQWGLVVNEAMAAGLPVLVSTGAGCAFDLVEEGGNGYRFTPTDEAQLAALLQRLASPDTDRAAMRQRSRAIIANWSPEVFAKQLWQAVEAGHARDPVRFGGPHGDCWRFCAGQRGRAPPSIALSRNEAELRVETGNTAM